MERFKTLDYRQKWIFLIMGVMVLVFTILYPVTLSRVGYSYRDAILVPHEAEGTTVYSGIIQGEAASFTVTQDKTVTFQYGDFTYGPYTLKKILRLLPRVGIWRTLFPAWRYGGRTAGCSGAVCRNWSRMVGFFTTKTERFTI